MVQAGKGVVLPGDSEFSSTWLISGPDIVAVVEPTRHAAREMTQVTVAVR